MASTGLNTTIERHYCGAKDPWLARARALTAAELGYPAFVHLHPFGTACEPACGHRVMT